MISTSRAIVVWGVFGCAALLCVAFAFGEREPSAPLADGPDAALVRLADPEFASDSGIDQASAADEEDSLEGAVAEQPSAPASSAERPHSKSAVHRRVLRVTAYCDRGITASGVPSGVGQCAAPADVPFGSKIYIPALRRTFVVTDRTHPRFRHNTVDIFIPSENACLRFGRSYLECHISPPPKYGTKLVSR